MMNHMKLSGVMRTELFSKRCIWRRSSSLTKASLTKALTLSTPLDDALLRFTSSSTILQPKSLRGVTVLVCVSPSDVS